jgi:hypothetical protein
MIYECYVLIINKYIKCYNNTISHNYDWRPEKKEKNEIIIYTSSGSVVYYINYFKSLYLYRFILKMTTEYRQTKTFLLIYRCGFAFMVILIKKYLLNKKSVFLLLTD